MTTNLPEESREKLITLYVLGFFIALGAFFLGFAYKFMGSFIFIPAVSCVVGYVLLLKDAYRSGFDLGYAQKPETSQKKARPLRTGTAHLRLVYNRNRAKR